MAEIAGRGFGNLEYCWARMDAYAPVIFTGALHYSGVLDAGALRRGLAALQDEQPLLRASIEPRGQSFRFRLHEAPEPVPLICLGRDGDDHWARVVEDELVRPFEMARAPLARCTLLQGDGTGDLIVSFHHSIVDSRSGERFLARLLALCAANGPDIPAPVSGPMLPALDALFPPAFRGLRKARHMAGFMARQLAAEMRYRRALKGRQPVEGGATARCRVLGFELTEDATHRLSRAARARRLPLNAVLQAAMLLALWRAKYAGQHLPMRGISFGDLRPFLDPPPPPDALGVYITMLQYTAPVGPEAELWVLADRISEQIYSAAKGPDKFAAAVMARPLIDFLLARKSMRMGMVALSFPGTLAFATPERGVSVHGLSGFIANNPLGCELAGFAKILNRRLGLDLQYLDCDMDSDTAGAIMSDIRGMLDVAEGERG